MFMLYAKSLWLGPLTSLTLSRGKETNKQKECQEPEKKKKKVWGVPGRDTGSVSASAHQQNSFLSPPVHCSGCYISHKPVVTSGGRYVQRTRVAIWVLGL